MPFRVTCPNCRSVAACPDDYRGKSLRCKKCGRNFIAGAPAPRRAAAPTSAPPRPSSRGRFLIAAALAVLLVAAVGLPAAYLLLKKNKPPDGLAAGPPATIPEDTGRAAAPVSPAPATARQEPAPTARQDATAREGGSRARPPVMPPDSDPAEVVVKPPPVTVPAVPEPVVKPRRVELASLQLTPPDGWQANYNKFLSAWLVTKPPPTPRSEAEMLRIEECPADARTPAAYAAHLKEKDFLNVDVPAWVEVGDKEDLPGGFAIKGVVKKYSNPKTPPVLGLVAVRDLGGLKVRCFSSNLRTDKGRDELLRMFQGAK